MGSLFTVAYSLLLLGAGIYAIMIGKNWVPDKSGTPEAGKSDKPKEDKIQYVIAGIILVYFGISSLYTLWV